MHSIDYWAMGPWGQTTGTRAGTITVRLRSDGVTLGRAVSGEREVTIERRSKTFDVMSIGVRGSELMSRIHCTIEPRIVFFCARISEHADSERREA